ncbi:BolA family transcriptional regulator [Thauera sp. CAU 1555]|uniref:BolA family transcriptional regulator n=1 Tax=Thauera sedimentorum TaxID=2767595 RepID=A0ABR9B823_9RHOO|nr:BolA family protein [Thauera sedimentorum]MBC9071566.1 BolA family transcriptional regulator [Thauera sedimentorum]MBD8502485.1 BolA family transcriptional regulator [Thauera sedimentorum]
MNVPEQIRERLLQALQPVSLDIGDDSALHAGHAGARSGGGHYRVDVVSDAFAGKNRVARQRMIYEALGTMMQHEIHALAIRARTAEEAANQPTDKETR